MKYQVTQQFIRDEEKLVAEFHDPTDAEQFIHGKTQLDHDNSMVLVYRLYVKQRLSREYNKDKIKTPISTARYAEGSHELPDHPGYTFKVRLETPATTTLAAFQNKTDAELFLQAKSQMDGGVDYHLYENQTQIGTWNAERLQSESGSNGSSNAIAFSPTPLNMKPFPPGTPPPWVSDVEAEEDDTTHS